MIDNTETFFRTVTYVYNVVLFYVVAPGGKLTFCINL